MSKGQNNCTIIEIKFHVVNLETKKVFEKFDKLLPRDGKRNYKSCLEQHESTDSG